MSKLFRKKKKRRHRDDYKPDPIVPSNPSCPSQGPMNGDTSSIALAKMMELAAPVKRTKTGPPKKPAAPATRKANPKLNRSPLHPVFSKLKGFRHLVADKGQWSYSHKKSFGHAFNLDRAFTGMGFKRAEGTQPATKEIGRHMLWTKKIKGKTHEIRFAEHEPKKMGGVLMHTIKGSK